MDCILGLGGGTLENQVPDKIDVWIMIRKGRGTLGNKFLIRKLGIVTGGTLAN